MDTAQHFLEIEEELLSESNDDLFNITSFGADMTFRELVTMYDDEDLQKPELQRNYVWTKLEASRFIDSILLGLPVPSIFLAKEENEKLLIVDGYQRIMTVHDFMHGIFSTDNNSFVLSNSIAINSRWRNKTFVQLTSDEQRRLKTTTIHSIIFQQRHPINDNGMYQIFERINTSGKTLKPQEIRNCIYQGSFNKLLIRLNSNSSWRQIVGLVKPDQRMYDLELILRFFAFCDFVTSSERNSSQINLINYLNKYMGEHHNDSDISLQTYESRFTKTMEFINVNLNVKAFRQLSKKTNKFTKNIQPAVFDAVAVATDFFLRTSAEQPINGSDICLLEKYENLLENEEFSNATIKQTTNVNNIKKRIEIACNILYGAAYEW